MIFQIKCEIDCTNYNDSKEKREKKYKNRSRKHIMTLITTSLIP